MLRVQSVFMQPSRGKKQSERVASGIDDTANSFRKDQFESHIHEFKGSSDTKMHSGFNYTTGFLQLYYILIANSCEVNGRSTALAL